MVTTARSLDDCPGLVSDRRSRNAPGLKRVEAFHGGGDAPCAAAVVLPWCVTYLQPFANVAHCPLRCALHSRELGPGNRDGDAEPRARAYRPCCDRGGAKAIAQVIDEDPADSVPRAAFRHHQLRKRAGQMLDNRP